MADNPQTPATAPAPTAGTPAPVGSSTEAQPTPAAPLTPTAPTHLDVQALLAADLAGPDAKEGQAEQSGTPTEEETDPLQRELDEEEQSEETPEATPEQAEGDEPEADPAESQPDETTDEDPVPKGMEDWPKQAVKRIQKQSEQIKALKAQIAQPPIQLTPTPANPLADVVTLADLDARITTAKGIREWCKANPEGGTIRLDNGATYEVTAEVAAEKLKLAESQIEAYPDQKLRLAEREKSKPWEAAETIAPGLLTPGTRENTFYMGVLKEVPEIAHRLPDYEIFMAAAARGMKMLVEEQEGTARYVRYEMKDGKIVPPKQSGKPKATSPASAAKPVAPTQAQPFRPTNQRPPVSAAGATASTDFSGLEAKAAGGDAQARRDLLKAELTAA